jgi:uncharacterized membrane protein YeaQ/YmgE (transglycosylase-associated protein family)
MGLLSWIIVGIIAGWLVGLVMKAGTPGVLGDMLLGVLGALVGGLLAGALFGISDPIGRVDLTTLISALPGAMLIVAVVRAAIGRPAV